MSENGTVTAKIVYDRDWTWVVFPEKPPEEVRTRLKRMGGRFSGKRVAWYFRQRHLYETISTLISGNDLDEAFENVEVIPVENWPQAKARTRGPSKSAKWAAVFAAAHEAGDAAAMAKVPVPMIVQRRENMLDDSSPVEKQWHVSEGACGFGSIIIRPGTCSAAKFARKHVPYSDKHYYGGENIGVMEYGQSYDRKMAYARAYAKVLRAAGVDARAQGQLD